jgi:acetyl-CoA carboxylase biotin carboxyl carrier protein
MDIKDIRTLIKIVTQSDITEFEMESGGEKLIIRRGQTASAAAVAVAPSVAVAAPATPAVAVAPPVAESAETASEASADDGYETIVSPIVGTFYRAPSPDSDSYVELGNVVEKGQTLCIVEAMKLMNEIEADYKCRIVKVLKENAQPVEFGDPLFLVEPL